MNKINVIGTSGTGKSYFSRQLAEKLAIPYIEMDAILWQPNWIVLDAGTFMSKIAMKLEQKSFVLDGNHSKTNAIKWQHVDTIIWLDYSFLRTFKQVVSRSFIRSMSNKEIWEGSGNIESFKRSFLSSDSVILWMLKNYWKTKKKYRVLFNSELLVNKQLIHLTSPKKADEFLANL